MFKNKNENKQTAFKINKLAKNIEEQNFYFYNVSICKTFINSK